MLARTPLLCSDAGAPLPAIRRPGRRSVISMEKKHAFTPGERWAVFATYGTSQGTKCWLCSEPLNFRAMEVDHVLPECLHDDQAALTEALIAFGLPQSFDLNSFENWLPAHRHCNLQKLNHVFRPTPLIQLWLDRARARADDARQKCNATATERQIERAIGILATGDTALPPGLLDRIVQNYATANSEPVIAGDRREYVPPNEVRLEPNLTITFDRNPRPDANGPFTYKIEASGITVGSPVLEAPEMKCH
jgi:5-methylcytosine-specific restriction endonuclease McrA